MTTHRFFPRFFGGVEAYTLRLAHALQQRGHTVHILTGEPIDKPDLSIEIKNELFQGIPLIRLEYDFLRRPVAYRAAYHDPAVTAQIKSILYEVQPDVVHATSLSLLMGGTIEAAKSLKLPFIYTATDFVLTCRRGTYIKYDNSICTEKEEVALCTECMRPHTTLEIQLERAYRLLPETLAGGVLPVLENFIGKRADFVHAATSIKHRFRYLPYWREQIDHVIAPSSYIRDRLLLNNFPVERITVSPYGITPPPPDFKKIPSSKIRFGYIGRITPIKGVHLLIEAFTRLNLQDGVELTLYGKADVNAELYIQKLKQKVEGAANIKFAGFVDNAKISDLYQKIDVLVVPSIWPENSPITILEAQAHGIPVIASDVGGITDLVNHESNGLLFANQNVDDLIRQIKRCVSSPEFVSKLATRSQLIKSIDTDAKKLVSLYENLCTHPNSNILDK
ncbi:MAG: glycosyltransferase family 4 protein [Anaerolineae bacterium]|nr:glycosyltransferase family 4 protein [Anaerolineae bacterium]